MLIPLLMAAGLYAIPGAINPAHASQIVGKVCIAKDGDTACPVVPPLINSTLPPAPQLRIGIVINSSAALNGFDITILANSMFLKPASVATGPVLQNLSPSIVAKCIGGIGSSCSTTTDNPNTIHYAISAQSPTLAPTTGVLFTANYTILGATASIPIGFQTGCGISSVSDSICVQITNGGAGTADPETAQGANFSNKPYFDLQPFPRVSSMTIPKGGFDASLFLNVTSFNGFAGTVGLIGSVTPSGPTVKLLQTSVKVNGTNPSSVNFGCCQVNITVASSVIPMVYILNFTATSSPLPPNTFLITLNVPPPDFLLTPSPKSLQANVTSSNSTKITVSSIANFAGQVNLTVTRSPGLNVFPLRTNVNITASGSASATFVTNSTVAGIYDLNITGTSGQLIRTINIKVTVLNFNMKVPSGILVIPQGAKSTETITFEPTLGQVPYNLTITIKTIFINQITPSGPIGPSTGLAVGCSPRLFKIISIGTGTGSNTTSCQVLGSQVGNYTVTVLATSGLNNPITNAVTFPVQVTGPDYTFTSTTTVQTITVGKSVSINAILTRLQNLNSSILLSAVISGTGSQNLPTATINPLTVGLNATFPNGNATVTVTTTTSTPTGTYTLTLVALSQKLSISHSITIIVVVTTTSSPHDMAVNAVTASPNSANVGTAISIVVIVQNKGKATENATVVAIVADLSIKQQNATNIQPGENRTITFTWDTSSYNAGSYMVGGKVLQVPGETNLDNNLLRSATPVTLTSANTSVFQSAYFQPGIIAALVVIVAIVAVFLLQARRKPTPSK